MTLSSVLVTAHKGRLPALLQALGRIPEVEIHQKDHATDRVICIIEAENADAQTNIFEHIHHLDDTLDISLVAFHFDEETNDTSV